MSSLVSIITPNYNCARFIAQTIESVLAQTHTDWEMLIVDDCSTDGSYEIALEYAARDPRIKVMRNERNSGAAVSRNRALDAAQGEYIAFLDSDDLWEPCKLERQIKFMRENSYNFSYAKYAHIDSDGNRLNVEVSGPKIVTKRMMFRSNYVGCLTVMYNRVAIGALRIPDNIQKRNDHALWLKAIQKSNCYLIDEILAYYRKRTGSISSTPVRKMLYFHYRLYRKSENMSVFSSIFYVLENLFYGYFRKKKYTKSVEGVEGDKK